MLVHLYLLQLDDHIMIGTNVGLHAYTSLLCAVPKESGDFQAAGTTASCTAQGFFDSLFYGTSVLMNAILALTYCIIVKRGMRDEARSRRSLALVSNLM